jgi:hypothetical protein
MLYIRPTLFLMLVALAACSHNSSPRKGERMTATFSARLPRETDRLFISYNRGEPRWSGYLDMIVDGKTKHTEVSGEIDQYGAPSSMVVPYFQVGEPNHTFSLMFNSDYHFRHCDLLVLGEGK